MNAGVWMGIKIILWILYGVIAIAEGSDCGVQGRSVDVCVRRALLWPLVLSRCIIVGICRLIVADGEYQD